MPLSPKLNAKLMELAARHEEVRALLADPAVLADRDELRALSKEFAELAPVAQRFAALGKIQRDLREAEELAGCKDPELQQLAREDLPGLKAQLDAEQQALKDLLTLEDPSDASNVFLEIRAGTGGDEAALFAGDLFRMYFKFAERRGWRLEVLSERPGEHGGFKEIVARVDGRKVYSELKFESGVHRVQRVPNTESQGRIHTSACTVAVLPEADDIEEVEIDKGDLRVDLFRASGAGGQHVNKTDSAVRLTHLPTGIVVECQDERSQHKNRARALSLLRAKLLDAARARQQAERAESRRNLVGSGDRSERIRTYNFPQGRVTDHRIDLSLYKLDEVLQGALSNLLQPLAQEHQTDRLASLGSA